MNKYLLAFTLAIAIFVAGCVNGIATVVQAPAGNGVYSEDSETVSDGGAGSANEPELPGSISFCGEQDGLDGFMLSVTEQSDIIRASLENDPLTQHEMNERSQELRDLWEQALDYVLEALKPGMTEAEFSELMEAQDVWLSERDAAVEEAGRAVEGGSLYPLVVNLEAAQLTQARALELYALHE